MTDGTQGVGGSRSHGITGSEAQSMNLPGKGIKAKPMTFLKMQFTGEQAEKLWQIIIQNFNREIEHMKQKQLKALKKLHADSNDDD